VSSSGTPRLKDAVTVCICTFKRPDLLADLLGSLEGQATDGSFTFDVVVVDNDSSRSAEAVVRLHADRALIRLTYDVEPERNIAQTRNRAVRWAKGNLIAFIDDDERPVRDWLLQLVRCLRSADCAGVLGPVVPEFPVNAPAWLKRGRFFDRRRHPTGTAISAKDARTGNVLLRRELFGVDERWFDPAFGRTGGEDTDFFARQFQRGARFVWCDEAVAWETIPPERWTSAFHLKRLWRAGTVDGEWMRDGRLPGRSLVARNLLVLGVCAVAAAPSLVLPKHLRMRVAQKLAYAGGVLTAYFGMSLLRERD
jgi:glycosyltransferase involved in cell wall biosynthesis